MDIIPADKIQREKNMRPTENMKDRKEIKKINVWTKRFFMFKKINLATFLYTQSSTSLYYNWLYIFLPILFFSIIIFSLVCNEVLYSIEEKFAYINDLSNSLCLTMLFFFIILFIWILSTEA